MVVRLCRQIRVCYVFSSRHWVLVLEWFKDNCFPTKFLKLFLSCSKVCIHCNFPNFYKSMRTFWSHLTRIQNSSSNRVSLAMIVQTLSFYQKIKIISKFNPNQSFSPCLLNNGLIKQTIANIDHVNFKQLSTAFHRVYKLFQVKKLKVIYLPSECILSSCMWLNLVFLSHCFWVETFLDLWLLQISNRTLINIFSINVCLSLTKSLPY